MDWITQIKLSGLLFELNIHGLINKDRFLIHK